MVDIEKLLKYSMYYHKVGEEIPKDTIQEIHNKIKKLGVYVSELHHLHPCIQYSPCFENKLFSIVKVKEYQVPYAEGYHYQILDICKEYYDKRNFNN